MTWGKIDDKLHSHPKADDAGLAALGLWALALSYCCDHLTDGHVSRDRLAKLAGKAPWLKLAGDLCSAKLWHAADERCKNKSCDDLRRPGDGFRFHDWADHQPLRADVEAERARKQEAGRRGGFRKAANSAVAAGKNLAAPLAPASPVLPEAAVLPIPSRPDPGEVHAGAVGEASISGASLAGLWPTDAEPSAEPGPCAPDRKRIDRIVADAMPHIGALSDTQASIVNSIAARRLTGGMPSDKQVAVLLDVERALAAIAEAAKPAQRFVPRGPDKSPARVAFESKPIRPLRIPGVGIDGTGGAP